MQTKAAVLRTASGPFNVEELTLNEPDDNQILVRIVATGMCHTDLAVRDQLMPLPLPIVLGHEGAGIVERVGKNIKKVVPGDHVVLSYSTCGLCHNCLAGEHLSCEQAFMMNFGGRLADGKCSLHAEDEDIGSNFFGQSSFSNYALSYERNTVKVTKDVPLELLGPLGCGIQTGAGSVLNALKPPPGSSFAVFGSGAVGLSAVMGAVVAGCTTIIAVDIKDNRLELAKELGATHTINAANEDPASKISSITGGRGVKYLLETSGNEKVLEQALWSLAMGGVAGIVGAPAMGATLNLNISHMLMNRTLRGIIEGASNSDIFIPTLIELYQQGRFPFDSLIKFYNLDEINQAADDSESGVTIKPVIRMTK
jgi:aryl-alcohol dehydrogenase